LGWPEKTPELDHWYPAQVLITGWEIIFLWVARMVMLGQHFLGEIPFPTVFISPLVFDAQGRKMSKSLGNAIDPMDLVEKYGADAFRIGILRQMRLEGQEIRFQESRCEEARNFNNKIWNATRYIMSLPEGLPPAMILPKSAELTIADRWILTRLHDTIVDVSDALDGFDFGGATERLWRFVWYEFCDWYLEATKAPENRATRAAVLSFVWNNAMRLLHPVAPFITEEVWLSLPHDGATIMTASWPDRFEVPVDRDAARAFEAVRQAIESMRAMRSEMGLPPKASLPIEIPANVPAGVASLLLMLASGERVDVPAVGSTIADAVGAVRARAPVAVLRERYRKEVERLRGEVERLERKLGNAQFVAKASADVVSGEREKLEGYRSEFARVQRDLADLDSNG
jgi:valyl-tRNA synthetase